MEGFLAELLKTTVTIETLLESESNKQSKDDRSNRVDLLVRTSNKEHVIIEVQAEMEWDYLSRILYGASKAVTEYIYTGQPYREVRKIISVSIVFFNLGRGEDYVYHGTMEFRGTHRHDVLQLSEHEQMAYGPGKTPTDVFPEYYVIKVNQFNQEITDKFDEWVYFLKTEQIKATFSAAGIKSAAKKLAILSLTEQERKAYESYEASSHYEASMHESTYGRGKLEGKAEGLIEGEARGKAETLIHIIKRKFNQGLAKEDESYVIAKIHQARIEQLNQWIDEVFDLVTVADLFNMIGGKAK